DSSPEAIAAADARVVAIGALDRDLGAAEEQFAARAAAAAVAGEQVQRAGRALAAIDRVTMPAGALDAIAQLARAQRNAELCDQALAAAETVHERAEAAVTDAADLTVLLRAADAHDELVGARTALGRADADLVPAIDARDRAHEIATRAVAAHELAA